MNYKSLFLFFTSAMFYLSACSSSESSDSNEPVHIVKIEINAWLDLMPGPSPGKFHLTGNIILNNSGSGNIDNIKLTTITVYSEKEVVYSFTPYFNPKYKEDDHNLNTGSEKEFVFGSGTGLKINEKLEENNMIDILFNFVSDEGNFNYEVKNISVERAY